MFKRLLGLLLLLSLALLAGAVLHTLTLSYGRPEARPPDPLSFDTSMAIERFAGAIRIPTVSQPEQAPDLAALTSLGQAVDSEGADFAGGNLFLCPMPGAYND